MPGAPRFPRKTGAARRACPPPHPSRRRRRAGARCSAPSSLLTTAAVVVASFQGFGPKRPPQARVAAGSFRFTPAGQRHDTSRTSVRLFLRRHKILLSADFLEEPLESTHARHHRAKKKHPKPLPPQQRACAFAKQAPPAQKQLSPLAKLQAEKGRGRSARQRPGPPPTLHSPRPPRG